VKEEVRGGRSIAAGIAQGYKKGLSAIIDANVVTLMTAFILFVLATSGVKGFAFTLGVGTIVSLLTAVVATQAALTGMGTSRLVSSPSALGASKQKRDRKFDFMGASRWFFSLSGLILMVGALAIGGKGLKFGIDFTSGTRIVTSLAQPANENQVRDVLATLGVNDAKIQRVDNKDLGPNGFQISTKELKQENVVKVEAALAKAFGATKNFNSESVGPTFGQTVADSAVIAIIASLLVISAYIALRFEWKFAVPVLIALMHDLLITAGVYALTGLEVTTATVAALLTILGYSLYDTIIVFDRVRENTPRMPRAAFSQIVNRSMSEVLTRSLATSFCTLIPVASLLVFGGATLKNFAFALLVGVASGAYSSVFIASPVLTYWKEREPGFVKRAARQKAAGGGAIPAYYQGVSSDATAKLDEAAAAKPAVKRPVGPDGMEQLSADEFARMAKEVAEDLAEDPVFEHAPDEAESDDSGRPDKPAGGARKNKRHGRNR